MAALIYTESSTSVAKPDKWSTYVHSWLYLSWKLPHAKRISTGWFVGYTCEGLNITLTPEEDARLCRLAKGDLDSDDDVSDNRCELNSRGWDGIWRRWDLSVSSDIAALSLSGRILIRKENKGRRDFSFLKRIYFLRNPSIKSRERKDRHRWPIETFLSL